MGSLGRGTEQANKESQVSHAVYVCGSVHFPLCARVSTAGKRRRLEHRTAPLRSPAPSAPQPRPRSQAHAAPPAPPAPPAPGRKERGGASRRRGPAAWGRGARERESPGKRQRRAPGCLPRLSLLAVPPVWPTWESRPPAQVGPVAPIGKGVCSAAAVGGIARTLALRPGAGGAGHGSHPGCSAPGRWYLP